MAASGILVLPTGTLCEYRNGNLELLPERVRKLVPRSSMIPLVNDDVPYPVSCDVREGFMYVAEALNEQNMQAPRLLKRRIADGTILVNRTLPGEVDARHACQNNNMWNLMSPGQLLMADNSIYLSLTYKHCVEVFDADSLEFRFAFGHGSLQRGLGEGQLKCPRGLAVYKNHVYVADGFTLLDSDQHLFGHPYVSIERVMVFTVDGAFSRTYTRLLDTDGNESIEPAIEGEEGAEHIYTACYLACTGGLLVPGERNDAWGGHRLIGEEASKALQVDPRYLALMKRKRSRSDEAD